MNETKETPKPAPKPPDAPKQGNREAIRVRVLRFVNPTNGAGLNAASSCTGVLEPTGQSHYIIEFLPWMRHFKLEWHRPHDVMLTTMVHETAVGSWDPA